MALRIVQSKQNARVKELRAALLRSGRMEAGVVAIEGMHLLEEALRSDAELATVFVAIGQEHLLDACHFPNSVEILALPQEVLDSAVSTEAPQPVAALALRPLWGWPDLLGENPLLVVMAGIQDPGNLGTMLRSAEAFAATGAVCLPGTVSPWNAKAMRASAGSVFRLPVVSASDAECFARLREAGVRALAAMPEGAEALDDPYVERTLAGPVALIIGSEGSGLAPEIAAQCDTRVTIPCPGPVESLNAAVAASILLYEAARRRALSNAGRRT